MKLNEEVDLKPPLEYLKVLKRRSWLFLLPLVGVTIASAYLAFSLPSTYRSQATVLIEDRDIPKDAVGATIPSYAIRQVHLISRRLLTVWTIQKIVHKLDVYDVSVEEEYAGSSAIANTFRKNMELALVGSEEVSGERESFDPVAFTLAFENADPEVAQRVTEELVSLFLNENRMSSASKTGGVSEVLRSAADEANQEVLRTAAELAAFKKQHKGALPDLSQLRLDAIERTEQELADVNLRIQQLQQSQIELAAQLAQLEPSVPVTLPTGETIMNDLDRLRTLLFEFRRKAGVYRPEHPDLVRLEREIETLRRSVGDADTYELLREQVQQERNKLSALREKYLPDHPDVRSSEKAIATLESQLALAGPSDPSHTKIGDNPEYVLTRTQLDAADVEIQALVEKEKELEGRLAEHEALIAQTPHIQVRYDALRRDHENAKVKYTDLQTKLRSAEIASDLELGIAGRRFTLIEPPSLPVQPYGPNRSAISMLGVVVAMGIAVGSVILAEVLDNSIRTAGRLTEVVGEAPLVVIPYLSNSNDAHARNLRVLVVGLLLVLSTLCVWYGLRFVPQ